MTRTRLPWTTRTAVLTGVVACLSVTAPPSPASAATRSSLYALVDAAAADYNNSATTWRTFVTADRTRWSAVTVRGGARLADLRARLHVAGTQRELDAIAPLAGTERTRARVLRAATLDLRSVLPGSATATRQVALSTAGSLTLADRVSSITARRWTWSWVTDATARITGSGSTRTVTLTRDGRTVRLAVTGLPGGSSASVVSAPSGVVGPDGRALRVVVLTLGATRALALGARIA